MIMAMRLCRLQGEKGVEIGLFDERGIVPIAKAAREMKLGNCDSANLLDYLPPDGRLADVAQAVAEKAGGEKRGAGGGEREAGSEAARRLLVPVAEPKKVILLAGNYAEHIREQGWQATEREQTFPYYFWKPPSTTLTNPGDPIVLPAISPDHVDWEVELGVIIGRQARNVPEREALDYVAGYTVCNDVSDRNFKLQPKRQQRERDRFFDWLHGKWHDTFLPMGPCVLATGPDVDPQQMALRLRVNGQTMQDGSTSQMIFPVAALISILSSFMTLERGDTISTGTPSGVGHGRKPPIYLRAGDVVEAEIEGIGVLRNPVVVR
jgi:2-keto-4-pentenoate hydratase/2-oxohepta-3-ene-1,7-dioic acid hydratase in catechol pathway